jgi:hypothetical protein
MEHVIFQEWNMLQDEAAAVDACFQQELSLEMDPNSDRNSSLFGNGDDSSDTSNGVPNQSMFLYASNYILSTKIGLMDHHVGLGIELGIFHGHYHLLTAFWYREFLLSAKLSVMTNMMETLKARTAMEEQIQLEELMEEQMRLEETVEQDKQKGIKGKKKGKKNAKKNLKSTKKDASQCKTTTTKSWNKMQSEEENEKDAEYIFLNAKRILCRGIVRVSVYYAVDSIIYTKPCCVLFYSIDAQILFSPIV